MLVSLLIIPSLSCLLIILYYYTDFKSNDICPTVTKAKLFAVKQDKKDVEEFIRRLKKYTDVQELTLEMCLELIEYITIDEYYADRPRDIHIYYKLLDKPLKDKRRLDTAIIK